MQLKLFNKLIVCHPAGRKRAVEFLIKKGENVNAVESTNDWTPTQYLEAMDDDLGDRENWSKSDSLGEFKLHFLWIVFK